MHPPFYIVDHRATPETRAPWEDRKQVRRGGPERLELWQPQPGVGLAALHRQDASGDPPAPRSGGAGLWLRLRSVIARRPGLEPAR